MNEVSVNIRKYSQILKKNWIFDFISVFFRNKTNKKSDIREVRNKSKILKNMIVFDIRAHAYRKPRMS